jgi:arylsulfatase A-like enzyme/tetratricopeptide (TPR) repeat protein
MASAQKPRVRPSLRFTFILILAALGTGLAAIGGWRFARVSSPITGPIVIISIDTLRADHLPVFGYDKVRTPAIDALARDGTVFERAYAHTPQTLPSHASMLSGRLPFETGVRDNMGFVVKRSERLLQQMLRDRGYATGGVVSAYVLRKETGIGRGFDFFDSEMPEASPDLSLTQVRRDGAQSVEIAEHWLDTQGSPRTFLFLHLYEPHTPYTPPARFSEYLPYDGEIAYADELVGRLVSYLRERQLYDRATIVLVSDHGEGLGDHGELEHGLFLYDEDIRVPLIIKQANGAGAGRRVAVPVQLIDLVPTILDFAHAPMPSTLRGRSLRPLLEGQGSIPEQGIYAEALYSRYHFGWSELVSLTDARYRFIRAPRAELYDLERDPHEQQNAIEDRPQVAQAMRGALDRRLRGVNIEAPAPVAAEDRERLQSLGYVGGETDVPTAVAGDELPDPKDKLQVLETYRKAVDLANRREYGAAITLLKRILADEPDMAGVWDQLAALDVRAGRLEDSVAAYKKFIELKPDSPTGYLGAAASLVRLRRLDEAQDRASSAVEVSGDPTAARSRASAHELLARIALIRKDPDGAREQAGLAQKADPTCPMPPYIEGRLLHDQGKYEESLGFFQGALKELQKQARQLSELHFYTGDTLARLGRNEEAEAQLRDEIRFFPQGTAARAALATLYRSLGQDADVETVIGDMLRTVPTPDAYALAARLWTTFGEPKRAASVRAESRRVFAPSPKTRVAKR